jgi:TolA-binding protein
MTTIDELLTQRRRGALSAADERRLQMAVQTSREHQLTLLAGEVFDRAGAAQSNDAALIKHIVRQVEGEWSGTFQRVVARRRLSRWVSVPALIAGMAAASFGGYRALPFSNPQLSNARVLNAPARTAPAAFTAAPAPFATPSPLAAAPGVLPEATPRLPPRASEPLPPLAPGAVEPFTPQLSTPEPETPAPIGAAVPAPIGRTPGAPAGAISAAAAPAPPGAAHGVAAPHSTPGWNLPKPKRRAVHHAQLDTDVGGVLPLPALASTADSTSPAEADGPDLESAPALFRRANELRQSDWDAAAALYERLALRQTESREAGVAEMALGKHALAEGRAVKAVQWFEAYQRREGGELAAEAIWGEARALQSLGEVARARELWTRLIEQYPASAYAAAAREQLGP